MIRKEKALELIHEMVLAKENMVPLLDQHISSALPFSFISDKDRQTIVNKFHLFVNAQSKHLEILEGMRVEIQGSGRDVF